MVQWLRLYRLSPESLVSVPGRRTRSPMPQIRPKTLHGQINLKKKSKTRGFYSSADPLPEATVLPMEKLSLNFFYARPKILRETLYVNYLTLRC